MSLRGRNLGSPCPKKGAPYRAGSLYCTIISEGGTCTIVINQIITVTALLDSESMMNLVQNTLVSKVEPVTKTLRVICIHGDTEGPTRWWPCPLPSSVELLNSIKLVHTVIMGLFQILETVGNLESRGLARWVEQTLKLYRTLL